MLKIFQGKEGKLNIVYLISTIVVIVVLAWAFAALFGGKKSNYSVVKKNRERLEIITTDNSIPSTPVSKVPLKALGVLQRNNHRRQLPGFDIEGADMPN